MKSVCCQNWPLCRQPGYCRRLFCILSLNIFFPPALAVQLLAFNSPCHDGKCQTPAVLPKPLGEAWLHLVLINLESSSSESLSLTTMLPRQSMIENRNRGRKEERGEIEKRPFTLVGCFRKGLQEAQCVSHTEMRVRVFGTVPIYLINSLLCWREGWWRGIDEENKAGIHLACTRKSWENVLASGTLRTCITRIWRS